MRVQAGRSQFWKTLSMPFYGYDRPAALAVRPTGPAATPASPPIATLSPKRPFNPCSFITSKT